MKIWLKNTYYVIEFVLLFFGVPLIFFFDSRIIHPSAFVLPVLVFIIIYFRGSQDFRLKELITLDISKCIWVKNIILVFITGVLLALGVYLFDRENFFNLPLGNIPIWLLLCVFYPVFSAYGQEIIYRTFLFKRYKKLFNTKWMMILASAVTFSFVHIVYFSYISIVLSFIAGLYLAYKYEKTKSVLFTSILHGLFGNIVFTVGLGQYFWFDMFEWL